MKLIEILKELEKDPTLITEKTKEIKEREEELRMLVLVHKTKKSKLLQIINNLVLPANKLMKVVSKLRDTIREETLVSKELKALEYFKNGSSISRIENSLEYTTNKWNSEAQEIYDQLFN